MYRRFFLATAAVFIGTLGELRADQIDFGHLSDGRNDHSKERTVNPIVTSKRITNPKFKPTPEQDHDWAERPVNPLDPPKPITDPNFQPTPERDDGWAERPVNPLDPPKPILNPNFQPTLEGFKAPGPQSGDLGK